jgi:hypothetical protein
MQIKYAMKVLQAYKMSEANDWLDMPNALMIIERSEMAKKNENLILVEDIDAFFSEVSKEGNKPLGKSRSQKSEKDSRIGTQY